MSNWLMGYEDDEQPSIREIPPIRDFPSEPRRGWIPVRLRTADGGLVMSFDVPEATDGEWFGLLADSVGAGDDLGRFPVVLLRRDGDYCTCRPPTQEEIEKHYLWEPGTDNRRHGLLGVKGFEKAYGFA